MMAWPRYVITLFLALSVAGCKEIVNSDLQEREANEIIATLHLQGINASKERGKDQLYSVSVRKPDFGPAIAVLTQAGLPRETFSTIGELFPDDRVVGSAFAENARFSYALGEELSHTISEIEGVQFARVHVVVPPKDRFTDNSPPAKAALAIYHGSDFDASVNLPRIKQLVAFAVPNLTYEAVAVSLFPVGELKDVVLKPVDPSGLGSAAGAAGIDDLQIPTGDVAAILVFFFITLIFFILCLKAIGGIGRLLRGLTTHVR